MQEIARGDSGWQEHETDTHFWLTHRREEQWRGTGVGISNEIFDSVISRKQTARGMLALVKLRDRGKIILGSLHAYTGVTNRVYQQEIHAFLRELGGKWRKYPCVIGVDANEAVTWDSGGPSHRADIAAGSANLNYYGGRAGYGLISPVIITYRYVFSWSYRRTYKSTYAGLMNSNLRGLSWSVCEDFTRVLLVHSEVYFGYIG